MPEVILEFELKPYKLIDLYMTSKGITSKWLSDYADVSEAYICQIRSGKASLTEIMRNKINELLDTNY